MVYCPLYRLDCDVVNGTGEPSADLASAQDGTNNLVVNQGLTYHQYLKVGKLFWSSNQLLTCDFIITNLKDRRCMIYTCTVERVLYGVIRLTVSWLRAISFIISPQLSDLMFCLFIMNDKGL